MSAIDTRSAECLSPEELAAWVSGPIAREARERALAHVEACATCRESASLLAQLESSQDAVAARTPASEPGVDGEDIDAAQLAVVGQRIGRFRVQRVLGRGGMGIVLLARDEKLERDVALKLVVTDDAGKSAKHGRLAGEAKALAALSHPNLVSVFEVGEHRELPFLVMELVNGVTLRAHVALEKPAWRVALRLCLAASRGLAALHEAGFIHRDIKPDNVMLASDGRVVVVDLGLAKRSTKSPPADGAPESVPTRSGVVVGTPRYLAPERVAGKPADVQSDVYAFAAMTLEMLRACDGNVPARVVAVLSRGLDPDPAARFGSIAELARALERAAGPRYAAIAIGVAAVGAALGWVAFHEAEPSAPTIEPVQAAPEPAPQPTMASSSALVETLPAPPSATATATPSATAMVTATATATATPSATATAMVTVTATATPSATATGTASTGKPWVSGPAASAGAPWVTVDTSPMPPVFGAEWMKKMGRAPTTYEVGYQEMTKGYEGDCVDPDKTLPWGADWGVVDKIEVADLEKDDGGKTPMLLASVKGQRKRYVFSALLGSSYLDVAAGTWVFMCPGAPGNLKLPAGWQGDFVWMKAFGPIKGPPAWASSKPKPRYLKGGPGLSAPPGNQLDNLYKPGVWADGDGPFIFGVTKSKAADAAKGTVDMGSYFLEADGKSRNVTLLAKAASKNPIFVIARFVRLQKKDEKEESAYPVVRVDEVLPSLFAPPAAPPP